jgi:hypothetical protein
VNKRPLGILFIAIFAFSTCVVLIEGAALLSPDTALERVWSVQLLVGRFTEGGIGVAAAGAILFYLTRPKVRETSASSRALQRPSSRLESAQNP